MARSRSRTGAHSAAQVESLGKPFLAVLVTHAHPDHYGGIVELVGADEVPVIATAGVDAVIRRDDAVKEEILRPMFGAEWPQERTFPNQTVADRERVELGDLSFTVWDLGPSESPHDSIWLLGDEQQTVFIGDQVYDRNHAYLADSFFAEWLANIERLPRELPSDATLYVGHGGRSRRRSSSFNGCTSRPSSTPSAGPTGHNRTRPERR